VSPPRAAETDKELSAHQSPRRGAAAWFLRALPFPPAPTGALCPPQPTARPPAHVLQLVEGVLKASFVVGRALGHHPLHVLLEDLLVPDVGLHQVLEARHRFRLLVELGGEREGSGSRQGDGDPKAAPGRHRSAPTGRRWLEHPVSHIPGTANTETGA